MLPPGAVLRKLLLAAAFGCAAFSPVAGSAPADAPNAGTDASVTADRALDQAVTSLWRALSHSPRAGEDIALLRDLFHADGRVYGVHPAQREAAAGPAWTLVTRTASEFIERQGKTGELAYALEKPGEPLPAAWRQPADQDGGR